MSSLQTGDARWAVLTLYSLERENGSGSSIYLRQWLTRERRRRGHKCGKTMLRLWRDLEELAEESEAYPWLTSS